MQAALIAVLLAAIGYPVAPPIKADLIIHAKTVLTGDGRAFSPGVVVTTGGKITFVGAELPVGTTATTETAIMGAVVTPGFIDIASSVALARGAAENEEQSETTPAFRVSRALDARHDGVRLLREAGVTSAVVLPGSRNVIGGVAAAVKLRGDTAAAMMMADDVALSVTLGLEPAARNGSPRGGAPSLFTRRPNSRMGVVFEVRRAFLDAVMRAGATPGWKSWFDDADGAVLARVGRGELPIVFSARAEQDILTAVRLADEQGLKRFRIVDAEDAHLARALLAERHIPVVLGPMYPYGHPRPGAPARGGIIGGPRLLKEAGVAFAFGRSTASPGDSLLDQARLAVLGGLSASDALAAITSIPAAMAGLDSRVGTIAVGKDADLNIFVGDPFAPTASLRAVVIDGTVVYGMAASGGDAATAAKE